MRRPNDFYATPAWQTHALLREQPDIGGVVLDPCVGTGSIAGLLPGDRVITNDWDTTHPADFHLDAAGPEMYAAAGPVDWVITNPPYRMPLCLDLVARAVREARVGVAMLLRITFREPTRHRFPRGPWLAAHPISRVLTLPRYSYTGDGRSDSVTTEWCIWLRRPLTDTEAPILSLVGAEACDGQT